MTYRQLLFLFQSIHPMIDETAFYFSDDPKEDEHYIGCHAQNEKPYWVGLCNIENGCDFLTAEELFNAKIFNGKSLAERWENVILQQISSLPIEDWMKLYRGTVT